MIDLLRLCRLYYCVPMSLAYALTVYYARGGRMEGHWPQTILSTVSLALVVAGGYVLNDFYDYAVDRANAAARPIAAGRVRPGAARAWAVALFAVGLGGAAMCRPAFLIVLTAVAGGLVFYDRFSKRLDAGKPCLVAALMTSIYPLAFAQAGGAVGGRAATLLVFPIWLFMTAFGYEVLKDIRDIGGDRTAVSVPTAIQRNPRRWRRIAAAMIAMATLVLVGPFLLGCGRLYMAIAGVAILMGLLAAFSPIRRAIVLVYIECLVVGVAATADVIVLGA